MYEVYQDVLVQKNTDYTISVDVDSYLKMSVRALTVQTSGEDKIPTGIVSGSGFDVNIVNDSTYGYNNRRYSRTFNTGNYEAYRIIFYAWHYTTGEGFNTRCVINHPQLEKGNKATDWAPSPLDSQEQIDKKASQEEIDKLLTEGGKNLLKNTVVNEYWPYNFTKSSSTSTPSIGNWKLYDDGDGETFESSGDTWEEDDSIEIYGFQAYQNYEREGTAGELYYQEDGLYQDVKLEKNTDYVFSFYSIDNGYTDDKAYVDCKAFGYINDGPVHIYHNDIIPNTGWNSKDFTWNTITFESSSLTRVYKSFNTGDYDTYRFRFYGVSEYNGTYWDGGEHIYGVNYIQLEKGTKPTAYEDCYDALKVQTLALSELTVKQSGLENDMNNIYDTTDYLNKTITGTINLIYSNELYNTDWQYNDSSEPRFAYGNPSQSQRGYWFVYNSSSHEQYHGCPFGSWYHYNYGKEINEHTLSMPQLRANYSFGSTTHNAGDIIYCEGGIYQDVYLQENSNYTFSILMDASQGGYNGAFVDCKALSGSNYSGYSIVADTGFNITEWEHYSGNKDWSVEEYNPYYYFQPSYSPFKRVYITFNTGNYHTYRIRIYNAIYVDESLYSREYGTVNRPYLVKGTYREWYPANEYSLSSIYNNEQKYLNFFYPVGSYYETSDTTFNPNNAWGGTWELEVAGQVHVSGAASGTYTVSGATTNTSDGGATTHNHGGKDGDVTLQAAQSGNQALTYVDTTYTLNTTKRKPGTSTAVAYGTSITAHSNNKTIAAKNATTAHSHTISSDNNMPPYIVVNRWHRTA